MNLLRRPQALWLIPLLGLVFSSGVLLWANGGSAKSEEHEPAKISAPAVATRELPVKRAAIKQPRVLTDRVDHHGNPVTVSCATCHETRAANYEAGEKKIPSEFHPALVYAHGNLSCLSCHNADDYDTLRRADGRALAYADGLALCAQCHGPQTRDYEHGSHGGMVGFWDKSKGPRSRNQCTDCHDVHAPAYPQVMPIFPPRDAGALDQARREAALHLINSIAPSTHD